LSGGSKDPPYVLNYVLNSDGGSQDPAYVRSRLRAELWRRVWRPALRTISTT